MDGVIVNYRQGRHHVTGNQMVVLFDGVKNLEKAKSLLGKVVVWKTPSGKEIKGKITKEHGRNGAVRVLFEKGMPGQSVGAKVEVQ